MSDASIQDFEQRLGQLEAASRRGDSLTDLMLPSRYTMEALTDHPEVIVLVSELDQTRVLAGTISDEDCRSFVSSASLSDVVDEVTIAKQDAVANLGRSSDWYVLIVRTLSATQRCICAFLCSEDPRSRSVLLDAARTLADILAEAAGRTLLSKLTQELQYHENLKAFVRRLGRSSTPELWAQEIAQSGVEHLGKGRVSVLRFMRSGWQLMAVTGSTSPNLQSDAIRRNEQLVSQVSTLSLRSAWLCTSRSPIENDEPLRIVLAQYAALGVEQVRVDAMPGIDGSIHYSILVELFDSNERPADALMDMVRHEMIDALHVLPRTTRSGKAGLFGTATRNLVFTAVALFLASIVIPADFEIEVSGQAFPKERRRIFAPDDGLVEELLVASDERVSPQQTILRLRNPERELELNRVLGEVESVQSRIQSIRTTRTSSASNNGTNTGNRSAELSGEEQQLLQKLSALQQEQKLVEQQIQSLTITAPIGGMIYQRRLQEQLLSRPAQRGQLLLEVVNTDGEWELELQIPESVVGYVQAAAGELSNGAQPSEATAEHMADSVIKESGPRVQFTLTSRVREFHSTSLSSLDRATHLYDGQLSCLATAMIENGTAGNLRPGQAVTARINCGRRSLAFVWFREVVEFWQRKKFTWL